MEKIISSTKAPLTALIQAFDAYAVAVLTAAGREFDQYDNLVNLHKGKPHSTTTKTYAIIEGSSGNWWIPHPKTFEKNNWKPEVIQGLIDLIPEEMEQV